MNLIFKENQLTSSIFNKLRPSELFQAYDQADVEIALINTLYSIVIYDDTEPIGMGRLIGDNRISFFIKDVSVVPGYRKQGIGQLIMKYLLKYIESNGSHNAYIGLMSTPNKEHFYEKFGFVKRPNESHGHGMIKFLQKGSIN